MNFDERIRALAKDPEELRFEEVVGMLIHYGYKLINVRGSHFRFKNRINHQSPSLSIIRK